MKLEVISRHPRESRHPTPYDIQDAGLARGIDADEHVVLIPDVRVDGMGQIARFGWPFQLSSTAAGSPIVTSRSREPPGRESWDVVERP